MNRTIKFGLMLIVWLIFSGVFSLIYGQSKAIADLVEIFDGRSVNYYPQIAEIDKKFVEKEVSARKQSIVNLGSAGNFRCEENDLRVVNVVTGAFSKPNSRQKAALYTLCLNGKAQYATYLGGIIITENEKILSHYIFKNVHGFDSMKSLPDINRNGLSELALGFNHSINSLNFARAIGIYEVNQKGLRTLAATDFFNRLENDQDDDLAYRIFVKSGNNPTFYRETYSSKDDQYSWMLTNKIKKISASDLSVDRSDYFVELKSNAENSPELTAKEISTRIIELIKNIKNEQDISPENIERVMKNKVDFEKANRNHYGFGGAVKGATNWAYNLSVYTNSAKDGKKASSLNFSFDSLIDDERSGRDDFTPVCAVNFDNYNSDLKNVGFSSAPHYGEHGRLLWWDFARENVSIQITATNVINIPADYWCVQMLTVTIN